MNKFTNVALSNNSKIYKLNLCNFSVFTEMNSPFMQHQHLPPQQFTPLPPQGYSAPAGYGAPPGGMMPPSQAPMPSYRGPPPQNGPAMQNNFPGEYFKYRL